MRTSIRIVAGELRGRKVNCDVHPGLRPTPQRVREALFSILGDAVPDRPFIDIFAGTGIIGLEALSRGAKTTTFVERDFRLLADLERNLAAFGVKGSATLARSDVYRWVDHWRAPAEPVTVFLSPPFADFEHRPEEMLRVIGILHDKIAPGSVLVLQAEETPLLAELPEREAWDERKYGRNLLLFWVKAEARLDPTSANDQTERQGDMETGRQGDEQAGLTVR